MRKALVSLDADRARPGASHQPASHPRGAVWLITVGACALRAVLAVRDDGLIYPDEVFQSLEQAHRLLYGNGFVPWEFVVGARPWVLPALLAPAMALTTSALGPKLLLALTSGLTCWACARLVSALGGSSLAALLASSFWALLNLGIVLGPRALGESACTLPLVLGLAWSLRREATAREVVLGSALLALAVMLRLHLGLIVVLVPVTWLLRGHRRFALYALTTLSAGALLLGALDWATWGGPFQSAREYLRFNWVEGRAAQFGVSGPGFYPLHLVTTMGGLAVVSAAAAVLGAKRAWPVSAMLVLFVTAHTAVAHKELRFVLPVLPLLGVLAAMGVEGVFAWRRSAGWGAALLLVLALLLQPRVTTLSWRALGIGHVNDQSPVFDDGGPENRLLARAGKSPEVCGVEMLTREVDSSAGFSALHRKIPLFDATRPPAVSTEVNAFIGPRGTTAGRELAVDGDLALVIVQSECSPANDFTQRLP